MSVFWETSHPMRTSSRGWRSALLTGGLSAILVLGLATVAGPIARAAIPADPARAAYAAPAQAAPKPTIVLVHGAWADASSWNGELGRLQRDGYVVRAIDNPLRGLTSDAVEVKDFLSIIKGPIVRRRGHHQRRRRQPQREGTGLR
jgi:hypothetical protein